MHAGFEDLTFRNPMPVVVALAHMAGEIAANGQTIEIRNDLLKLIGPAARAAMKGALKIANSDHDSDAETGEDDAAPVASSEGSEQSGTTQPT